MPLYEYECQACGHQLEVQQRMADAALTKCPSCGKDQLQKIISATAFHLKGGGWYKDLYSSSKPGASGESGGGVPTSGSAGKADGDSKSAPKSESKSESKSEAKSDAPKSDPKPSTDSSG